MNNNFINLFDNYYYRLYYINNDNKYIRFGIDDEKKYIKFERIEYDGNKNKYYIKYFYDYVKNKETKKLEIKTNKIYISSIVHNIIKISHTNLYHCNNYDNKPPYTNIYEFEIRDIYNNRYYYDINNQLILLNNNIENNDNDLNKYNFYTFNYSLYYTNDNFIKFLQDGITNNKGYFNNKTKYYILSSSKELNNYTKDAFNNFNNHNIIFYDMKSFYDNLNNIHNDLNNSMIIFNFYKYNLEFNKDYENISKQEYNNLLLFKDIIEYLKQIKYLDFIIYNNEEFLTNSGRGIIYNEKIFDVKIYKY